MVSPLISIITITLNNRLGLQQTIKSVLAQNYANTEFIVVDGGSVDGTPDLLRSVSHPNYKWVSEKDNGIWDAFNKSLGMATGDAVIFMNSGDSFVDSGTLAKAIDSIPSGTNVRESVIYGDYYAVIDSEYYLFRCDHLKLSTTNSINHQSVFVGSEICRRFKYDTRLIFESDYDYWLRLRSTPAPFIHIDVIVAKYDQTGVSSMLKNKVHQTLIRYFLVAINDKRNLTAIDAIKLCFRVLVVQAKVFARDLIGRRLILGAKRALIRLGLKSPPEPSMLKYHETFENEKGDKHLFGA